MADTTLQIVLLLPHCTPSALSCTFCTLVPSQVACFMLGMLYNLTMRALGRDHSREEQNMAQMTGGEAVIRALRHEGVEVVFGLPGVQIMGIYDAFYARSDIRIMTVRHEQTTAYMADG